MTVDRCRSQSRLDITSHMHGELSCTTKQMKHTEIGKNERVYAIKLSIYLLTADEFDILSSQCFGEIRMSAPVVGTIDE